jgi:hypothetical protein
MNIHNNYRGCRLFYDLNKNLAREALFEGTRMGG